MIEIEDKRRNKQTNTNESGDPLSRVCEFCRLKTLDGFAQPILDRVLGLALIIIPLQLAYGPSRSVERDVMTRHHFRAFLRRNEINQQTLAARAGSCGIAEVEATWRIRKHRSRLPGRLDRTAVATLLDKVEFSS